MHRHHEKAETHVSPDNPSRLNVFSLAAGTLSVAAMMAPEGGQDQARAARLIRRGRWRNLAGKMEERHEYR
jgi:hypothetical protein